MSNKEYRITKDGDPCKAEYNCNPPESNCKTTTARSCAYRVASRRSMRERAFYGFMEILRHSLFLVRYFAFLNGFIHSVEEPCGHRVGYGIGSGRIGESRRCEFG